MIVPGIWCLEWNVSARTNLAATRKRNLPGGNGLMLNRGYSKRQSGALSSKPTALDSDVPWGVGWTLLYHQAGILGAHFHDAVLVSISCLTIYK
jgi:hypothetical protein